MVKCRAPGCTKPSRKTPFGRGGRGRFCSMHVQRLRLHGTLQNPPRITKTEFNEYLGRVTRVVERGNYEHIDRGLRETAAVLADSARDLESASHSGPWVRKWSIRAAQEVLRVLDDIGAARSGLTVAAVFLFREENPHRFDSDSDAFVYELVRLWRSTTSLSIGSTWDEKRQRSTRWYRTLPARTSQAIAALLVDAYVPLAALAVRAYKEAVARPTPARLHLPDRFPSLLDHPH